jgi:hypothetical protein
MLSHEVIAVFELMQNEVNETITAVLDCNMNLRSYCPKNFPTDVHPLFSHHEINITGNELSWQAYFMLGLPYMCCTWRC